MCVHTKELSNVPEIRFAGFSGAWEQRKLGDMGTTFTGLSGKTKDDFGHGNARFVTYMNVFTNPVSDPDRVEAIEIDISQNAVQYGDVFFTTSSETPEEVGMSSVWLGNSDKTYLNSFCFGYRPTEKNNPYYMAYMLRSEAVRKKIVYLAQGISRYNISKNGVMQIEVPMPDVNEQRLVGEYFSNLDNLITLHQRKYDVLARTKKAMLQKMFPRDGAKVPEIRFAGFTGPWEQRKLGEYFVKYQNTVYLDDDTAYRQISIRNNGTVEYRCTNYGSAIGRKRQYVIDTEKHPDTLTFTRQTVYEGGIGFVPTELNGAIVTENMPLLDMHDADKWFMKTLFLTEGYYESVIEDNTLIGSAQKALHEKQWLESIVSIPSLDEQKVIGTYFEQIDTLITLHQKKYELLSRIKQALLQKMFV